MCCANPGLIGWIIDKEIYIMPLIRFRIRIEERNIGVLGNKKKEEEEGGGDRLLHDHNNSRPQH
jgi:hypothetical protein